MTKRACFPFLLPLLASIGCGGPDAHEDDVQVEQSELIVGGNFVATSERAIRGNRGATTFTNTHTMNGVFENLSEVYSAGYALSWEWTIGAIPTAARNYNLVFAGVLPFNPDETFYVDFWWAGHARQNLCQLRGGTFNCQRLIAKPAGVTTLFVWVRDIVGDSRQSLVNVDFLALQPR
jgi:hypothetical protein